MLSTARSGSIDPCAPETCHMPLRTRQMLRSAVSWSRLDGGRLMKRMVAVPPPDVKPEGGSVRLRRAFVVALLAVQYDTEAALAPFGRNHPWTVHPGRVVPHVLAVPAVEVSDPMALLVLMECDDFSFHCDTGVRPCDLPGHLDQIVPLADSAARSVSVRPSSSP